jgi:hypothetical protein
MIGYAFVKAISNFLDRSFWQQLVVTSAGVIFGIPFALWLNRRQVRHEDKKEAEASHRHEKEVRDVLCRAIEKNKSLLQQMATELKTMAIFYNVDLSVFESLPSTEILQSGSLPLSEKLAHLRYELTHLHRKIELQLTIEFDGALRRMIVTTVPQGNNVTEYDRMRTQLIESIQKHLPSTIKACDDALNEIGRIQGEVRKPDR